MFDLDPFRYIILDYSMSVPMETTMPPPPATVRLMKQRVSTAAEVLEHARRSARKEEEFSQDQFRFSARWDHILESQCVHLDEDGKRREGVAPAGEGERCAVCDFASLPLPQLPEMIFPRNGLAVEWNGGKCGIRFDALDALRGVDAERLPDVQVAPSAVWQESRRGMAEFRQFPRPFDWTYTTKYAGTVEGVKETPTDRRIDMAQLTRQDPIKYYAQVCMYEDELADHGCAEMSVRVRVMPGWFFALARFYLRIDHVLIRVCDTRVYGETGSEEVVREWTMREARVEDMGHLDNDILLDGNRVWQHMPIVEASYTLLTPEEEK